MREKGWAIVLLLGLATYFYFTFNIIRLPGDNGYISDEVWYVSASRNLLQIFGLKPHSSYITVPTRCNVTNALYTYSSIDAVLAKLPSNCSGRIGYTYPDKPGILDYLNLEHPPLGKYIIASALLVCDWPICWRLPSVLAGFITLVLVFLALKPLAGPWWASLAVFLMAWDRTFTALSGVAMLDVFLAAFTTAAIYTYLRGRLVETLALIGMAGSIKYSGFFPLMGLVAYYTLRRNLGRVLAVLVVPLAVGAITWAPLAFYLGLGRVLGEVSSAISWHLTSRPAGPISSTPLDWLLMRNSFVLHLSPDVVASGTPAYLASLIIGPYAYLRSRDEVLLVFLTWGISTFAGYCLVYAMGNRTLYSFYTAHFSPLLHLTLAYSLYKLK